jgi:hypothetical protein
MSANAIDPPFSRPSMSRHASRLKSTLSHVRTTDTHPPHHAHFDVPEGPPSSPQSDKDHHDAPVIDIEHVPVDGDPREWSRTKKHIVLFMMTLSVVSPLCRRDGES